MDRTLSTALVEITGRAPENFANTNVAAEKGYAVLYKDVMSRIRVPPQLAESIYRRNAYMTHFFDQTEIDELVRRWSGQGPRKTTRIDQARAGV